MYPIVRLVKDPDDPNKPIAKKTPKYLEILTFFPDNSLESNEFLHLLNSEKSFEKLYP
jgi:CRISPR-associated protein Cmr6